jgi:hypothetical protein
MTVKRLLREADAEELAWWAAWERVNGPLGPQRFDLLVAHLAAILVNTQPFRDPNAEPVLSSAFLIDFDVADEEPEPPTPEEMRERAELVQRKFEAALQRMHL